MERDAESHIIRRELDTDTDSPAVEVAMAVADLENVDPTQLANMYDCVDGMLDELFSTPPDEAAQLEVAFSYADYRITVYQDGVAEFVGVGGR